MNFQNDLKIFRMVATGFYRNYALSVLYHNSCNRAIRRFLPATFQNPLFMRAGRYFKAIFQPKFRRYAQKSGQKKTKEHYQKPGLFIE